MFSKTVFQELSNAFRKIMCSFQLNSTDLYIAYFDWFELIFAGRFSKGRRIYFPCSHKFCAGTNYFWVFPRRFSKNTPCLGKNKKNRQTGFWNQQLFFFSTKVWRKCPKSCVTLPLCMWTLAPCLILEKKKGKCFQKNSRILLTFFQERGMVFQELPPLFPRVFSKRIQLLINRLKNALLF